MPIPPFNEHGLLSGGLHECSFEELQSRFGSFQSSDRRVQLCNHFLDFLKEAKASQLVEEFIIDGSFVTAKPIPNDIDIIVVLFASHNLTADLPPRQYNIVAEQRVRRRFGFDIVVVRNGTENLAQAIGFFAQVRQQPGLKKGLLRIKL